MKISLFPPVLHKGDTIGVIAPAGHVANLDRFNRGVQILHEMGFEVKFPRNFWPGHGYLADTDDNRGREFNVMYSDPEVKALIALRGGYGCIRMIGRIDLEMIRRNPKPVIGFSDITILLNYLFARTGLVSFHGPVATSLGDSSRDTLERLYLSLTGGWSHPIPAKDVEILKKGPKATAPVVGGNLASLVALLGTPYDFSWDEKIVLLEDVNEPAYKIDRMLTQLQLAGKFDRIAGLILGDFSISQHSHTERLGYLEMIWNRALEILGGRSLPVWGNFPSGHCPGNLTIPLGAVAEMEGDRPMLSFITPRNIGGYDI